MWARTIRQSADGERNCKKQNKIADWADEQSPRVVFLKEICCFSEWILWHSFSSKEWLRNYYVQTRNAAQTNYRYLHWHGNNNDRFRKISRPTVTFFMFLITLDFFFFFKTNYRLSILWFFRLIHSGILLIRRVSLALKTNLGNNVWPLAKIIKEVTHELEQMNGFSGEFGAIDRKHIRVLGKRFCNENYTRSPGTTSVCFSCCSF